MGKLPSLPSSGIPTITPGIGHNSRRDAERDRNRRRAAEHVWRRWYGLKEWKGGKDVVGLRYEILERDEWVCQRTGVQLLGVLGKPDSPVVHHIVPHDGDWDLFWDPTNLQAVSKEWHDTEGQKDDLRYRGAIKRHPSQVGGG